MIQSTDSDGQPSRDVFNALVSIVAAHHGPGIMLYKVGRQAAMIGSMEPQVLHITEADLVRDVRAVLQQLETAGEIIIERNEQPVAVLRAAAPIRRTISECIALLSDDSPATIDSDFAKDVDAAVAAHREPLEPPAWD